jgi:hypothetical protein
MSVNQFKSFSEACDESHPTSKHADTVYLPKTNLSGVRAIISVFSGIAEVKPIDGSYEEQSALLDWIAPWMEHWGTCREDTCEFTVTWVRGIDFIPASGASPFDDPYLVVHSVSIGRLNFYEPVTISDFLPADDPYMGMDWVVVQPWRDKKSRTKVELSRNHMAQLSQREVLHAASKKLSMSDPFFEKEFGLSPLIRGMTWYPENPLRPHLPVFDVDIENNQFKEAV